MKTEAERIHDKVVYIGNELEDADIALWKAMNNIEELARKGGLYSCGYSHALVHAAAMARASVQGLKRAVEEDLISLVDEDFPVKEEEE